MLSGLLQTFTNLLPYLSIFGLLLDIIGAVIVLGPEMPGVAWGSTQLERRRLHKLVDRVEQGETIDDSDRGFKYLQTAVGQIHREGSTLRPDRPDNRDDLDLYYHFEIVEPESERIALRTRGDGRGVGTNIGDLRKAADNFTASSELFYRNGAFALVAGFFFQLVVEVADLNSLIGFSVFMVGSAILISIGHRYS